MVIEGKTIARIEERPTSPRFGYADNGEMLLHFTDGSAAKIIGHSYEECALSIEPVDALAYVRAAQGRRERERLQRLQREELAAQTPEERERREAARRWRMTPLERGMEDAMRCMARSFVADMNRAAYGAISYE